MNAPTPDPGPDRHHRHRAPYVVGAAVVALLVGVGTVAYSTSGSGGTLGGSPAAADDGPAAPVAPPRARVLGASKAGVVRWDGRLRVAATGGALAEVRAVGGGSTVPGTVGADGTWTSTSTLVPSSPYLLSATVVDGEGERVVLRLRARTTDADKTIEAALSPGDGRLVGVGQPVIVRLDRDVEGAAARKQVEKRLTVRTSPAQRGAWRWMSDSELHYRGPAYWKGGTTISVRTDLERLRLPGGVWGEGSRTSTFEVGRELKTVVDVGNHTMTVSRGSTVLRTMRASMGKPGFETRGGNFLVLEKHETKVMDGSTLATPQDYSTTVKHAVRITNSGTFTHGAPWSVASQGRRNVSHGCINLSPDDAEWFFDLVKRGDVVTVVNAEVGPNSWDAGSQDWNMSWTEWQDATDGA